MKEDKLQQLAGQMLNDLGGAFGIGLVRIGSQLGLYAALRRCGPVTSEQLARETGCAERYVREWLSYHAASGYVAYDTTDETFTLTPEQAAVFAEVDGPFYLIPAFDAAAAYLGNQKKVQQAFQTGAGVSWGDQTGCLFCAVADFFRPGYKANLVTQWLPALGDMVGKLEKGAKVADVGCGHGHSTILMAEAFPNSEFIGFDFHEASIDQASAHAAEHGLHNVRFEAGNAKNYPGRDYDLVTFFDCLHDMGDPAGAAVHVRKSLKSDGRWMIVEPMAGDRLEDNMNPVSRLYYAASTMVCIRRLSTRRSVQRLARKRAKHGFARSFWTRGGFQPARGQPKPPLTSSWKQAFRGAISGGTSIRRHLLM
jgi:ubiquinone/menaquinone biosynthesis C-methylase UbiE